ncbi:MAG: ATP synthase F0 subunit B [Chloroflexi bacterium RBG_13_56_8]|nr:MAG: ATP synthase F0 subunit B [Chloroflexi bacterium RBG_13_56_8]
MKELGLDLGLLLSQVVNFGLLLALLYAVLHKPILNKLEERARRIREGYEEAERAGKLRSDAEEHYQEEIERARREAHEIVEQATRRAQQQRQEMLVQAREEAHDIVLRAQQQARHELQEKEIALRQQVIDLAIAAASRVIEENLEEEKHHQLIREFLNEVSRLE